MYLTRDLSKEYRIVPHYVYWAPEGPLWVVRPPQSGGMYVFREDQEDEARKLADTLTKRLIRDIAQEETGLELLP